LLSQIGEKKQWIDFKLPTTEKTQKIMKKATKFEQQSAYFSEGGMSKFKRKKD
jgi:hypothetical protein